MINNDTLKSVSEHFFLKRLTFEKEDFEYILNRKKMMNRFTDFLTRAYYQRKKLVKDGFVGVCYTYRIVYSDGKGKNHRTFALFSPNTALMLDEAYFTRVITNIEEARTKDKRFATKKFLNYYSLVEAKPRYYDVDRKLTEDKIVFLQYIELIPSLNPNLKLGLNYVIYAPLISKELLYLPESYFVK